MPIMRTPLMTLLKTLALRPKFLALMVATPLLLLLAACEQQAEQQAGGFPPTAVSVAEVVVRDITLWEEFSGRIEAKERVKLRPRVSGVIEKIHYREGDVVQRGDLLFVIDQQPFHAALNRANADLTRAKAAADLARSEIRRAKNLLSRKLLSQDEFDQRVSAETQANANVRSAEATTQLAKLNLGYTEIRAPIDGRTGRAQITTGNLVSSSDLLTTIFSIDPVYVYFDSDELTYLEYFGNPQQSAPENKKRPVFVGLGNENGFPREGYVNFIDNQVTASTGTIRLRAVLENKNHQLLPGMFTRVKLLAANSTQSLLIADHAILTDQDRRYIYVLGEKNTAVRRDIKIGRTIETESDDLRIVTEGLTPGEQVIVHGIQKIFFPNMPVVPQIIGMNDPAPVAKAPSAAEH